MPSCLVAVVSRMYDSTQLQSCSSIAFPRFRWRHVSRTPTQCGNAKAKCGCCSDRIDQRRMPEKKGDGCASCKRQRIVTERYERWRAEPIRPKQAKPNQMAFASVRQSVSLTTVPSALFGGWGQSGGLAVAMNLHHVPLGCSLSLHTRFVLTEITTIGCTAVQEKPKKRGTSTLDGICIPLVFNGLVFMNVMAGKTLTENVCIGEVWLYDFLVKFVTLYEKKPVCAVY